MRSSLLVLICCLLLACSHQQTADTPKEPDSTPLPGSFKIPAMRLAPSNEASLQILPIDKSGMLSVTYSGKAFPDLHKVKFYSKRFSGIISVSKIINGITLSKQLIDTPLKISNFALDKDKEIYIITTQQTIYKFSP